MYCQNCGKQNDDSSKFCIYCGHSQPEQHIFHTPSEIERTDKTDKGYFAIALLMALNVAMWLVLTLAARNAITGYESMFRLIRVISVLVLIAQFTISFVFTKKDAYRITIAILGLACSGYYIYYLIDDFKKL